MFKNTPSLILAMALTSAAFLPLSYAQEEKKAPAVVVIDGIDRISFQVPGKVSYSVDLIPEDRAKMASYNDMPDPMKIKFQVKRRFILKSLVQVLRYTKFAIGTGSMIGDKIGFVFDKVSRPFKTPELKDFPGPMEFLLTENESTAYEPKEPEHKKSISELGNEAISKVIKGMDAQMWERAPLIANSNEFGIAGSIGVMVEGGVLHKAGFGGAYDLGLSVGFNKETKSFVFQIFQNVEKYHGQPIIMPVAAYAGINTKIGVQIVENSPGRERLQRTGTSEYPVAIPFAKSDTPSSFTPSFSAGIFPPPPFDLALSFHNTHSNTVLLRVAISPVTKGFVSVASGIDGRKLILQPINDIYRKVRSSLFGNRLCSGVHLN